MAAGAWSACHLGTTLQQAAAAPQSLADMMIRAADATGSAIVYAGSGYTNVHAAAVGNIPLRFREVGAVDLDGVAVAGGDLSALDLSRLDGHPLLATVKEAYRMTRRALDPVYLVTMTAWGPFTNAARLVGEERFIKSVYKDPGLVDRTVEIATELLIRYFAPLAGENALELITIGEPTASGDLISRRQFERFALPALKRFFAWTSARGIYSLLHVCGNTTDRFDLFGETGASAVSLDHKADIGTAVAELSGHMCVAGNVDPVSVLLNGTPENVRAASLALLEKHGANPGFILMPGCDIPPAAPLENIQAFINAGRGANA
ncbi:MAG: uroporphyrinogen decarboxylase family protein [Nitrospinae bacterium]|nr:uroporphyrinogen decarboxylase family protein [Nitrospinota bacterium]